jgi:hypothetical protein
MMNDRQLLDDAQHAIPSFHWEFITTEAFGTVAVADHGKRNGFVLMTETDFWLDQRSGPLSSTGEPELSGRQRETLTKAINLSKADRLHGADLVIKELFS